MAHTFSDAVFNYGDLYFRDYYDWLEQTLQIAGENSRVNWILKPHPTRSAYHESKDSIEAMFRKYKKDNLVFLPDEISAESIKNFADVLVTIGSNAGGEFACFGIPSVIVGIPYYQGMGFTIEPQNREEYRACLLRIEEVGMLDTKQADNAKRAFYLRNTKGVSVAGTAYLDAFAEMIKGKYKVMTDEMALQYFESNRGTEGYNSEILECITEYERNHDLRDCEYYRQGRMRGEERNKRVAEGEFC